MEINDRKNRYTLQQGFMIMEAIVVTCMLISLMSLGSRYITQNAERTVNQITAQQLRQVTKAAQNYVQDHHQKFKDHPSETVTWQDLVDSGYLPSQCSDTNNYGQSYGFTIEEENGLLQLVVTTDSGHPISEQSLRQIAAQAGPSAGYASGLHPDKIVGHQESCFLEGIPLKKGHLASLTIVNDKEVMDAAAFLRRIKMDGHPDYNQMETDLTFKENKKIFWDSYGYKNPVEGDVGVSSVSAQGVTLGPEPLDASLDEFTGSKMKLNRNTLEFDSVLSLNKTVGKLKITSSYHNGSTVTSPSILMESAGKTPGTIRLVANPRPSISLKDNNTCSTDITTAEINLESQASGNKSYIGNDRLKYLNKTGKSSILDGYAVVTENTRYPQGYNLDLKKSLVKSQLTPEGVVVPIFRFTTGDYFATEFAKNHCYEQAVDGSLFIVDSRNIGTILFFCCDRYAHKVTASSGL